MIISLGDIPVMMALQKVGRGGWLEKMDLTPRFQQPLPVLEEKKGGGGDDSSSPSPY